MRKTFLTSVIIELVGIATVACGLGVEIALRADIGYILITGGALVIAGGGMLFAKIVRRSR